MLLNNISVLCKNQTVLLVIPKRSNLKYVQDFFGRSCYMRKVWLASVCHAVVH